VIPPERMSRPIARGSPSAQTKRPACRVSALRISETPTRSPTPVRSRRYSAAATA
jgi:hypothetical protein